VRSVRSPVSMLMCPCVSTAFVLSRMRYQLRPWLRCGSLALSVSMRCLRALGSMVTASLPTRVGTEDKELFLLVLAALGLVLLFVISLEPLRM
jgi:hypothetical protein